MPPLLFLLVDCCCCGVCVRIRSTHATRDARARRPPQKKPSSLSCARTDEDALQAQRVRHARLQHLLAVCGCLRSSGACVLFWRARAASAGRRHTAAHSTRPLARTHQISCRSMLMIFDLLSFLPCASVLFGEGASKRAGSRFFRPREGRAALSFSARSHTTTGSLATHQMAPRGVLRPSRSCE